MKRRFGGTTSADQQIVTPAGFVLSPYYNRGKMTIIQVSGRKDDGRDEFILSKFSGFPGLLPGLVPEFIGGGKVMVYYFEADDDGIFHNGKYHIAIKTNIKIIDAVSMIIDDLSKKHREHHSPVVFDIIEEHRFYGFNTRCFKYGYMKIKPEYEKMVEEINLLPFEGMSMWEVDILTELMVYNAMRAKAKKEGY